MRSYKNKAQELANVLVDAVINLDVSSDELISFVEEKFCNNTDGLFPDACEALEAASTTEEVED
jgi:hypothetical protein